jgi:hypothetical protein
MLQLGHAGSPATTSTDRCALSWLPMAGYHQHHHAPGRADRAAVAAANAYPARPSVRVAHMPTPPHSRAHPTHPPRGGGGRCSATPGVG